MSISLIIRSGNGQKVFDTLQEAIRNYPILLQKYQMKLQQEQEHRMSIGMQKIITTQKNQVQDQKEILDEGLSDIKSLEEQAKKLVQLAEQFQSQSKEEGEQQFINELFRDVGRLPTIENMPLEQVLSPIIEQKGGVMSLLDAFVIYNRTRGTDLVTPQQFKASCQNNLQQLKLRQFPSKSLAIVKDEEVLRSKIKKVFDDQQGISATKLGEILQMPPGLCKGYMLLLEQEGYLARDDCQEGLFFYRNILLKKN